MQHADTLFVAMCDQITALAPHPPWELWDNWNVSLSDSKFMFMCSSRNTNLMQYQIKYLNPVFFLWLSLGLQVKWIQVSLCRTSERTNLGGSGMNGIMDSNTLKVFFSSSLVYASQCVVLIISCTFPFYTQKHGQRKQADGTQIF